jgi:hypothetical protein
MSEFISSNPGTFATIVIVVVVFGLMGITDIIKAIYRGKAQVELAKHAADIEDDEASS